MQTETDVKLAADLADFRLEAERRFGTLENRSSHAWAISPGSLDARVECLLARWAA